MGNNFELRLFSEVSKENPRLKQPHKPSTTSVNDDVEFIISLKSPEDIERTFRLFKNNYENGIFDKQHFIYFLSSTIKYLETRLADIYENINRALSGNGNFDLKLSAFWNYMSHISEVFTYDIRKFVEDLVSKWELDISLKEEVFNCIDEVNRVYISEISYFLNRWNYNWSIKLWFILSAFIPLKKLKTQKSQHHIDTLKNLCIYWTTINEADAWKQNYLQTLDRVISKLKSFDDHFFIEVHIALKDKDVYDEEVNKALLEILWRCGI